MKLTRKLILALVVIIFGIMAADAFLQLRREVALFEEDMALDETAMGQAVRVAVETAADDRGIEGAQAVVERIRASEDRVAIRWVRSIMPDRRSDARNSRTAKITPARRSSPARAR